MVDNDKNQMGETEPLKETTAEAVQTPLQVYYGFSENAMSELDRAAKSVDSTAAVFIVDAPSNEKASGHTYSLELLAKNNVPVYFVGGRWPENDSNMQQAIDVIYENNGRAVFIDVPNGVEHGQMNSVTKNHLQNYFLGISDLDESKLAGYGFVVYDNGKRIPESEGEVLDVQQLKALVGDTQGKSTTSDSIYGTSLNLNADGEIKTSLEKAEDLRKKIIDSVLNDNIDKLKALDITTGMLVSYADAKLQISENYYKVTSLLNEILIEQAKNLEAIAIAFEAMDKDARNKMFNLMGTTEKSTEGKTDKSEMIEDETTTTDGFILPKSEVLLQPEDELFYQRVCTDYNNELYDNIMAGILTLYPEVYKPNDKGKLVLDETKAAGIYTQMIDDARNGNVHPIIQKAVAFNNERNYTDRGIGFDSCKEGDKVINNVLFNFITNPPSYYPIGSGTIDRQPWTDISHNPKRATNAEKKLFEGLEIN